jgi:hypothetical protein
VGIGGRGIGVPASPKPRPIPIQNLDAPIELPTSALRARYHPPTAGIARRGTRAPRPADGIGSWPAGRRQGPRRTARQLAARAVVCPWMRPCLPV